MNPKSLMLLLVLTAVLSLSLTACNTLEGAGRDIQSAGRAIENAVDDDDDDN